MEDDLKFEEPQGGGCKRCLMNFVRCRLRVVANCVLALRAFVGLRKESESALNDRISRISRRRSTVAYYQRDAIEADIIEEADDLYKSYKIEELRAFLSQFKDVHNEEIQWRLARATHEHAHTVTDPEKRQEMMVEAFSYAEQALSLNDNSADCHRWYGALLHFTTESIGIKNKIAVAYEVREHFDRALELDPTDVIAVHSIGYWCYAFAERPWYQRKLASAVFMSMPETTYEQALEWFLRAEDMENVMVSNSVMVGKTYLRLKDKHKAGVYFKRALERKPDTQNDIASQAEAKEQLKLMGMNFIQRKLSRVH